MAIRAECDRCLEEYRVKDEYAGKVIRCKACGETFRVPEQDEFDEMYDPPPARAGRRGSRRGKSRRNSISETPWVVGVAIFVAVCAIGGGGLVAVNQMRRAPELPAVTDAVSATSDVVPVQTPPSEIPSLPGTPQTAPTGPNDLFDIASVPVPRFPELGAPYFRFPDGSVVHYLRFSDVPQVGSGPGVDMTMRVYLPPGQHEPLSIPCVLVGPAGTNLLVGNDMDDDDYHDETLPYVQAGMATIFYSLDGGVEDLESATDAEFAAAYRKFKAAHAGVVNGRNALEFVLAKLPQVDPERIYSAGHSSAGTLSLLLAQHEPRIKRCVAYAPATDVEVRLRDVLRSPGIERVLPELRNFLHRSSPRTHINRFTCPVFIFHSQDDSNERFATTQKFATDCLALGGPVTFSRTQRGGHYQSMIDAGIPRAIDWLRSPPPEIPESAPGQAAPRVAGGLPAPPAESTSRPPATPPPPGGPIVVFKILGFSGTGDKTAAARQALAPIPWAVAATVLVDDDANEIVVPVRGRSVSTGGAKGLLQRAGFQIGATSYMPSGRK